MEELNIKGFSFVNLELSSYEIKLFDIINIINDLDYNRFGNLKLLKKELIDYFKKVCNNDITLIKEVVNIICRIIDKNIKKLKRCARFELSTFGTKSKDVTIMLWSLIG